MHVSPSWSVSRSPRTYLESSGLGSKLPPVLDIKFLYTSLIESKVKLFLEIIVMLGRKVNVRGKTFRQLVCLHL